MIKRAALYVVFVAVASSQLSHAQNYLKGFVVQNNGDTVKGFINDKCWTVNPTKIAFKKNLDDRDVISFNTTDSPFQVLDGHALVDQLLE
jgi:hypothetical protein